MLDATVPKDHWQRPVHWKYAEYSDDIPDELEMSIRAFTAACSNPVTSPANGKEAAELLEKLFPRQFPSAAGEIDPNVIIKAKQRGETIKRLGEGAVQEEVESSAPLAEKIYVELRETVLCVLKEVSKVESSARVLFDHPFRYQTIGATDLLSVCVGPQKTKHPTAHQGQDNPLVSYASIKRKQSCFLAEASVRRRDLLHIRSGRRRCAGLRYEVFGRQVAYDPSGRISVPASTQGWIRKFSEQRPGRFGRRARCGFFDD